MAICVIRLWSTEAGSTAPSTAKAYPARSAKNSWQQRGRAPGQIGCRCPPGAQSPWQWRTFLPNIALDAYRQIADHQTSWISRLLDCPDTIERIRVKVAAFHGAH